MRAPAGPKDRGPPAAGAPIRARPASPPTNPPRVRGFWGGGGGGRGMGGGGGVRDGRVESAPPAPSGGFAEAGRSPKSRENRRSPMAWDLRFQGGSFDLGPGQGGWGG